MRIRLSVIAAIVMMTAGCVSEKDASDVILFVEPSAYTAVSGDAIYYDITSWTIHESLVEITFTTFDSSRGEQPVHTEQVGTKRYSGSFTYEVPSIDADSLVFEMRFKSEDNLGNIQSVSRSLKVYSEEYSLDELTAVSIYSALSGKPDGFMFSTGSTVSVAASPEGTVDIYMYQPEAAPDDEFHIEWRSQTGLFFSKVTGVDYPQLKYRQLRSVYSSARKDLSVTGLAPDDVVLIGTASEPLAAVKIMAVYDDPGTENDRCIFNMKVVRER